MLIAVLSATLMTLSSSLVAFGFAYFRFPFERLLFGLVLASMMLPGAVTLVPNYLIWNWLGWLGTNVPLWGAALFGSGFYIFLMRQFYLSLPRDLFEAARVDGCSSFGLWRRIAFPLALPSSIIVFIFEFQASWQNFQAPLIYLNFGDPGTVHGAAGDLVRDDAVQPDGRRPGGLPVRDGRLAAGHLADDDHLRLRPALLHRRRRHGRPEGVMGT